MSEQFANNAQTTLSAGMLIGDSFLTVTSAAAFPASGTFRVLIDSEIIVVGAVSGNSFSSLTRGAEGTLAAAHSNGATVTAILTAGALRQFQQDIAALLTLGPAVSVTFANSPYAVDADDNFLVVAAGAGAPTIVLLPAADGTRIEPIVIMRASDGFAQHVIVTPHGSDTINGANANYNVDIAYESVWFVYDAPGAWVIA